MDYRTPGCGLRFYIIATRYARYTVHGSRAHTFTLPADLPRAHTTRGWIHTPRLPATRTHTRTGSTPPHAHLDFALRAVARLYAHGRAFTVGFAVTRICRLAFTRCVYVATVVVGRWLFTARFGYLPLRAHGYTHPTLITCSWSSYVTLLRLCTDYICFTLVTVTFD